MPAYSSHSDVQDVVLNTEPVELYKILKFEALASSGAEAKLMIDDGRVLVNGAVELRRRRKIVCEDVIELEGVMLRMTRADAS